jgi:hypothetical protein
LLSERFCITEENKGQTSEELDVPAISASGMYSVKDPGSAYADAVADNVKATEVPTQAGVVVGAVMVTYGAGVRTCVVVVVYDLVAVFEEVVVSDKTIGSDDDDDGGDAPGAHDDPIIENDATSVMQASACSCAKIHCLAAKKAAAVSIGGKLSTIGVTTSPLVEELDDDEVEEVGLVEVFDLSDVFDVSFDLFVQAQSL